MRGGVEVAVRDDERDAVHTIRAEELIFNQATRFLTARGGVEYTVTTPDGTDTVRANSLTLDSESFEAVFVDGRVQREHDSGAGPVLFTFSGDTFRHLADDTIILDGARVTSSPDPDLPNYEIRAERMWLLAPGEWAIRNATLYVGRIPVLWVPFYFRPGDRLVFHPAVGIRDREGLFINTTLYLRGRRPEEDSPFSLLRAQADRYREERHGLFLRPVLEEDATDRMGGATPGAGADQSFLKLMLDAYARLGVHAGVAGSYPELQVGEGEANVAFRAGVARSRSIWPAAYGTYTAYHPATGESMWHDTSLFGMPNFPLRYALELDAGLALPYGTLRAGFQLFSDPDFDFDFGNRQERFNWPALVGFGEVLGEVPPQHRNLTWELSARGDLSPLLRRRAADRGVMGSLLVERLRLTTAAVRWFWRSRPGSWRRPVRSDSDSHLLLPLDPAAAGAGSAGGGHPGTVSRSPADWSQLGPAVCARCASDAGGRDDAAAARPIRTGRHRTSTRSARRRRRRRALPGRRCGPRFATRSTSVPRHRVRRRRTRRRDRWCATRSRLWRPSERGWPGSRWHQGRGPSSGRRAEGCPLRRCRNGTASGGAAAAAGAVRATAPQRGATGAAGRAWRRAVHPTL